MSVIVKTAEGDTIETHTKPGYKTTEFWKSTVVHFVALFVIAFGMWKGSDGIVQFGTILMGITQGTYNIGRSIEKGGLAKQVVEVTNAS